MSSSCRRFVSTRKYNNTFIKQYDYEELIKHYFYRRNSYNSIL